MNRSFTWDVGLLRGGGWGEQVKDLQVPALHFRSRSRRAPGRRSPRGAAGVLGPGLRLRVRMEPAAPRLRPLGPRACAVKPRRGPALGRSARERPATPAGQGAPCLPLGARGAGGSARKLVSPASQKLAASGLLAPRKQLQTRVGRVETCSRGTHQSKLQKP